MQQQSINLILAFTLTARIAAIYIPSLYLVNTYLDERCRYRLVYRRLKSTGVDQNTGFLDFIKARRVLSFFGLELLHFFD